MDNIDTASKKPIKKHWNRIDSYTLNTCCNAIVAMANNQTLEQLSEEGRPVIVDSNTIPAVFAAIFRNFEQNGAWTADQSLEMIEVLLEGMPKSIMTRFDPTGL